MLETSDVVSTTHMTADDTIRHQTSPALLLLSGTVLIFMTFMRYSLPAFGWVAFAPFLAFLHERGTGRRHLAVLAALVLAFLAAVSKMATQEIPWAPPVPMFAVPLAFSYFLAVSFASAAHRRLGVRGGIYTFASMTVVLGWLQYTFTPGSRWGVLAHTQLNNLPLVQVAAVAGIGSITFLVALGSGLAAAARDRGVRAVRSDLSLFSLLLLSALARAVAIGQPDARTIRARRRRHLTGHAQGIPCRAGGPGHPSSGRRVVTALVSRG